MRVRKVVTRSGKRYRGNFPSRKLGRMVQWESFLERDAFLLLEYHPRVTAYQEQPSFETYYGEDGLPRQYIPDLAANLDDGRVIVIEVKPEAELSKKKTHQKYAAIAQRFQEQGRIFRILTENDIRREPLHTNLRRIDDITRGHKLSIDGVLLEGGPTWTLDDAARQLGGMHEVLLRIRFGSMTFNYEERLTSDSKLWIVDLKGGGHDPFSI